MGILLTLKDSIRDALYNYNQDCNFYFSNIEKCEFPYLFFYITKYDVDRSLSNQYWTRFTLYCVLEYMYREKNTQAELWAMADPINKALGNISFLNIVTAAREQDFKTVDDVLQSTFIIDLWVKEEDTTEFMYDLDYAIYINNGGYNNGEYTT